MLRTPTPRAVVAAVLALGVLATGSCSGPAADGAGGPLVPVREHGGSAAPEPGTAVALRPLVVAATPDDVGLQAWRAVLDRIGTPYDVVLADREKITPDRLVRADGVGRYSAVLLASGSLPVAGAGGAFTSAMEPAEWGALWDYERSFHVRQVAINASPGGAPEDYCLRTVNSATVGSTPVPASLTPAGAAIFPDLRPDVAVPITDSYLDYGRIETGCAADAILTVGGDVVGVRSTAPDGRERLFLTVALGPTLTATGLLGYGLVRWATHGLFLGEQRHWLDVDVDDWFLSSPHTAADGSTGTFRLSGDEAAAADRQQTALRARFPQAGGFTLNLAFNASMLNLDAPVQCGDTGTPDALSSWSRCLAPRFRWINHTYKHINMDDMSYDDAVAEITDNLEAAKRAGLPAPSNVLKTPEISGLGVGNPDETSTTHAVDHGLQSSNANIIKAAAAVGVRYLHGNMSYAGHRPPCANCAIPHPLDPDVLVVPDWPTNIAYEAADPTAETAFYNAVYGPHGSAPTRHDRDYAYREVVDAEADIALTHLVNGSAYTHTLHQANLHEYAPGASVAFDWLNAVVERYSRFYAVPLENPDWATLGAYAEARTDHFAALAAGQDVVWDRAAHTVSFPPRVDGSMFITGLRVRPGVAGRPAGTDESWMYGGDSISRVGLTRRVAATFEVDPRP